VVTLPGPFACTCEPMRRPRCTQEERLRHRGWSRAVTYGAAEGGTGGKSQSGYIGGPRRLFSKTPAKLALGEALEEKAAGGGGRPAHRVCSAPPVSEAGLP
jgi:hypothetical protein